MAKSSVGGVDHPIRESNTDRGLAFNKCFAGHAGMISEIAWSPDGRYLASAAGRGSIWIWDQRTGDAITKIKGHSGWIESIAWSPDGRSLASAAQDNSVQLWSVEGGKRVRTLQGHSAPIRTIDWLPNGHVISGSKDTTVRIWDVQSGQALKVLEAHSGEVTSVSSSPDGSRLLSTANDDRLLVWDPLSDAVPFSFESPSNGLLGARWSPDGQSVVSWHRDKTIHIRDLHAARKERTLEGHTEMILSVQFSHDGLLLCSAEKGLVHIWNSANWDIVASIRYSEQDWTRAAFNLTCPLLAVLGPRQSSIDVWELDTSTLVATTPRHDFVHYTSAKVALVGDSGVGKTALGWRLTHGEYKEHPSSHGQQFWLLKDLGMIRPDGTECEAVLWDLAGQPDYRLIHSLFLDDVDLALVLFDAANRHEPLKGAEYWLKQLTRLRSSCRLILVESRADRGTSSLPRQFVDDFCRVYKVSGGYVSTSALTGEGVSELLSRLRQEISWDKMPSTVTTTVFKAIKDILLELTEDSTAGTGLLSLQQLRDMASKRRPDLAFTDEETATAVGQLSKHGYVMTLRGTSGEQAILLQPARLNNLAASFILEARRDPKGLGVLDEARVLSRGYDFPEIRGLQEKECETLLDSVVALFLRNHICFRESLGNRTFLVFPALITQKRPTIEDDGAVEDVSYSITGAVENVYAALVVLLGYTNTFTRVDQWQNQARYELDSGQVCGFRQIEEREGDLTLVLYFSTTTPSEGRLLFQGLFEKFLKTRNVSVTRYLPVCCTKCSERQDRNLVVRRIREGRPFMFCSECGKRIELSQGRDQLYQGAERRERLHQEQALARGRTAFETALVSINRLSAGKRRPSCFVSYAWGNAEHERWVSRFAGDLRGAGIEVILDQTDNAAVGSNVGRFITRLSEADSVITVGTPLYRRKYLNRKPRRGTVVAAEMDLVNNMMLGTEMQKRKILPILLAGTAQRSLPPLLQGKVYADFREDVLYFPSLFDLILTMFNLPFDQPAVCAERELMRSGLAPDLRV